MTAYDVEQQLSQDLEQTNAAHARSIELAFAVAWSELQGYLTDTLTSILTPGVRVTLAELRRAPRLRVALDSVGTRLQQVVAEQAGGVAKDVSDVVEQAVTDQTRLILAQLEPREERDGFDRSSLPDRHQLEAIIQRSRDDITSKTKPVAPDTTEAIRRELVRGIAVGRNPRDTAREMVARAEGDLNFGRARAVNVARTETLDAYRNGGMAGEQNHSKVLGGWLWLAHLAPGICPSCLARHGTLHDLEEPGPHDHPQGKCARMPVVRKRDGSVDISFVPDAQRYFDGLSKHEKTSMMGPERLALLRSGAIGFEDLSTRYTNPGWRPSYNVTPLRDLRARAARAS